MDKFNRLTRNEEWQVGARYRWTKGRESKLMRSVCPPREVTFLGWQHTGRRALVGYAEFLNADGRKSVSFPGVWRNRWVKIADPAPSSNPTPATVTEEVDHLVSRIDFPHLRDGGQWRREDQRGAKFSFRRACHYAEELRALGMPDTDIACLLSDLYWDAAEEIDLRRRAEHPAI